MIFYPDKIVMGIIAIESNYRSRVNINSGKSFRMLWFQPSGRLLTSADGMLPQLFNHGLSG